MKDFLDNVSTEQETARQLELSININHCREHLACKKTLLVTGDHLFRNFSISQFHDRGPLLLVKVVNGAEIS